MLLYFRWFLLQVFSPSALRVLAFLSPFVAFPVPLCLVCLRVPSYNYMPSLSGGFTCRPIANKSLIALAFYFDPLRLLKPFRVFDLSLLFYVHIQRIREENLVAKYSRFILTRSDMFFPIPHPRLESLHPQYLWVPFGNVDFGGIALTCVPVGVCVFE